MLKVIRCDASVKADLHFNGIDYYTSSSQIDSNVIDFNISFSNNNLSTNVTRIKFKVAVNADSSYTHAVYCVS